MRRAACVTALAVTLLLGVTPAWAESWVLWERDYSGWSGVPPQRPQVSLKSRESVGLYSTAPACLTAARTHTAARAQAENDAPRPPGQAKTPAQTSRPQESTNPPGVRIELKFPARDSGGRPNHILVIIETQCWPAGVTPQ